MTLADLDSATKPLDPTILRAYDIRGVIGETLSAADAHSIGRAYGTMIGETGGTRVCVGYDGRLSSPELEAALVDGLMRAGMEAIRVGLGPTPMLYFAVKSTGADAGIMISGSHNPPDYNGFKMTLAGKPFFGGDIQRLGEIAAAADYAAGEGSVEDIDIREDYVACLLYTSPSPRDVEESRMPSSA